MRWWQIFLFFSAQISCFSPVKGVGQKRAQKRGEKYV
nr:MAG TPA: hypothetical protein [Caudoviricetes sp.]